MVQHPQRVQSRNLCCISLLPVNPPEIYALFLLRVKYALKIRFQEFSAGNIKINRFFLICINISQFLRYGKIAVLICADSTCRVKIQTYFHSMFMQPCKKSLRFREIFFIPCVACPGASVFRVHLIYKMPVHIHYAYGKRNFLLLKTGDKSFVAFFCISVVTAPPVSQRESWKHGRFSCKSVKIPQSFLIIISIGKEINICSLSLPWQNPAILI